MAASTTISQFSCFSSSPNHRQFQLHTRSCLILSTPRYLRFQSLNVTNSIPNVSPLAAIGNTNLHLVAEEFSERPKSFTISNDTRLAIWLGSLALSTGLLGFVFLGNPVSVGVSVIFCSGLLVLNIFSLIIWKQGKSSLPFIIVQAVLFMALLWKNFQAYSVSQKTGFNVLMRLSNKVSPFQNYFKSYRYDCTYLLAFAYLASICINAAILCFVVNSVEGWRQSSA